MSRRCLERLTTHGHISLTILRNNTQLFPVVGQLQINTLRLRQNGYYSADDRFKCIFLNENIWISIRASLKFVSRARINNTPALVQIMAWRRPGNKPLSEPMMVSLLTHICVTRPQWVNSYTNVTAAHNDFHSIGSGRVRSHVTVLFVYNIIHNRCIRKVSTVELRFQDGGMSSRGVSANANYVSFALTHRYEYIKYNVLRDPHLRCQGSYFVHGAAHAS